MPGRRHNDCHAWGGSPKPFTILKFPPIQRLRLNGPTIFGGIPQQLLFSSGTQESMKTLPDLS